MNSRRALGATYTLFTVALIAIGVMLYMTVGFIIQGEVLTAGLFGLLTSVMVLALGSLHYNVIQEKKASVSSSEDKHLT